MMKKMTEMLTIQVSSASTRRELYNEYKHDRVYMVFQNILVVALLTDVASATERLK